MGRRRPGIEPVRRDGPPRRARTFLGSTNVTHFPRGASLLCQGGTKIDRLAPAEHFPHPGPKGCRVRAWEESTGASPGSTVGVAHGFEKRVVRTAPFGPRSSGPAADCVMRIDRASFAASFMIDAQRRVCGARSAVEDRPAQVVPQPLIIEHEFADLRSESIALPRALKASGICAVTFGSRCAHGSDRIRRRTELMGRHMRNRRRLSSGMSSLAGCAGHLSRCCIRRECSRPALAHRDHATRPGPHQLDRAPRSGVAGPLLLEEAKDVLGTIGRPDGKEMMVGVGQRPPTTHRDEPRISDLGQDHRPTHVALTPRFAACRDSFLAIPIVG
jgi:hypothetical protein